MIPIHKRYCTALLAIITIVLASCTNKKVNALVEAMPIITDTIKTIVEGKWEPFPLGDMNADNIPDTAFVYTSPYNATPFEAQPGELEFAGCVNDSCYNRIKFSPGYPEIWFGNSLWGTVEPIADLDEDGINEFIFQTNWWIGSHATIYIYSFNRKKEQWEVLAHNWVYGQDSYKDRITKIDKTEFKFNIEYTFEGDVMKKDTLIGIRK